MPELPEVEVTRRGLAPHLVGKTLTEVVARVGTLRGPLDHLADIEGLRLVNLERRAKMLIWVSEDADGTRTWMASHMGMSGSWRVVPGASTSSRGPKCRNTSTSIWCLAKQWRATVIRGVLVQ